MPTSTHRGHHSDPLDRSNRVHVEDLTGPGDGVTLLTFHGPAHATRRYARTGDVADVLSRHDDAPAEQVVAALAHHTAHWDYLCRCGPDVLGEVPLEMLTSTVCQHGAGSSGPLHTAEERTAAGQATTDVTAQDLFAFDTRTAVLTAFTTGAPISRVLLLDAPACWWDLNRLSDLLPSHPWVRGLRRYATALPAARPPEQASTPLPPGPPDHRGLGVLVHVPQHAYDMLVAAGQPTPFHVERALLNPVHALLAKAPLGADPLGITSALRRPEHHRRLASAESRRAASAAVPDPRAAADAEIAAPATVDGQAECGASVERPVVLD